MQRGGNVFGPNNRMMTTSYRYRFLSRTHGFLLAVPAWDASEEERERALPWQQACFELESFGWTRDATHISHALEIAQQELSWNSHAALGRVENPSDLVREAIVRREILLIAQDEAAIASSAIDSPSAAKPKRDEADPLVMKIMADRRDLLFEKRYFRLMTASQWAVARTTLANFEVVPKNEASGVLTRMGFRQKGREAPFLAAIERLPEIPGVNQKLDALLLVRRIEEIGHVAQAERASAVTPSQLSKSSSQSKSPAEPSIDAPAQAAALVAAAQSGAAFCEECAKQASSAA